MKRKTSKQGGGAAAWGLLVATAVVGGGCAAGEWSDPTVTVAEALGETSEAVDVPGWLQVLGADRPQWGPEAFLCDSEPETTQVEVCGKQYPATVHLEWSNCLPQGRPGGRPGAGPMMPPGGPAPEGGMGPGGGMRSGGGAGPMGRGERRAPPVSSGTVDLANTVEALGTCGEGVTLRLRQQSSFDISRQGPDGQVMRVSGTMTASSEHAEGTPPASRATTVDTTHTLVDAQGNTERSLHLTGTLESSLDHSVMPPRHITRGSLTEETAEGRAAVVVNDVVRVPPHQCRWPVAGSLERTLADGTRHVLSFGPECGQATLDGQSVTLPEQGPGGPGHRHPRGPGMRHPPMEGQQPPPPGT